MALDLLSTAKACTLEPPGDTSHGDIGYYRISGWWYTYPSENISQLVLLFRIIIWENKKCINMFQTTNQIYKMIYSIVK